MRGEHFTHCAEIAALMGSSPHARGARRVERLPRKVAGIIPACAGSTVLDLLHGGADTDHPRMRGEHWPRPVW